MREVNVRGLVVLVLVALTSSCAEAKPKREQPPTQQPPSPTGFAVREVPTRYMAAVCLDVVAEGAPMSACPLSRQRFAAVTEASMVRWCDSGNTELAAPCDYKQRTWRRFDRVQPSITTGTDPDGPGPEPPPPATDTTPEKVEVCTSEKTEGAPMDGCTKEGSTGTWAGMLMVEKERVAKVPPMVEGTFTLEPEGGGTTPLEVRLRWNVTGLADVGAYPCNATADPPNSFDGTRAAVGDELVTVMANTAFTLTCARIPPSAALATWDKPTTNTDGTPLTTLQGYILSYGNSVEGGAPALAYSLAVPPDKTAWLFDKLTPVRWWFGIQTRAGAATENPNMSELSNLIMVDLKAADDATVQRFTQTLHVVATPKPEPPPKFTVSKSEAYQLNESPNALSVEQVGVVPLGTPCDEAQPVLGKYVIDRTTITPAPGQTVPDVVVAECVEGTWQPEQRSDEAEK